MTKWPLIRDILLFFAGLAGVAHEALFTTTDRPELLILYAAMMGLPAFLNADKRIEDKAQSDKELEQ